MSTHTHVLSRNMKKYQSFLPEKLRFLEVKFSVYLNRHVFVMFLHKCICCRYSLEVICKGISDQYPQLLYSTYILHSVRSRVFQNFGKNV